jgi:uncharacterized BrkB/YihY/UPF0761 family membrane protein
LMKLVIAGGIFLWSVDRMKRESEYDLISIHEPDAAMPHPRYIQMLCIIIAVILVPTMIFFRIVRFDRIANAVMVGGLVAISLSYKVWFEKRQKQ